MIPATTAACGSIALLLAGCALVEKSVDRSTAQAVEGVAGLVEWFPSLALALSLPELAVADRIEAGQWPAQERLHELLEEIPVESIVCDLSVIAVTDLEYHIQYSLLDPTSEQCSYVFAGMARYIDAPELCFESFVWPIDTTAREPAEPRGSLICESTLPNGVPVPLDVLFPAPSEMNDETRERLGSKLAELLRLPPREQQ